MSPAYEQGDLWLPRRPVPASRLAAVAAIIGGAYAVVLTVLSTQSAGVGGIGLGALYVLPALLAWTGRTSRPGQVLLAAVAWTLLAFSSMAGAALPLLLPAMIAFLAYGRMTPSGGPR